MKSVELSNAGFPIEAQLKKRLTVEILTEYNFNSRDLTEIEREMALAMLRKNKFAVSIRRDSETEAVLTAYKNAKAAYINHQKNELDKHLQAQLEDFLIIDKIKPSTVFGFQI